MDQSLVDAPAFHVLRPEGEGRPVLFASPHSGSDYPPAFVRQSVLDPLTLRRSEDSFVDRLFEIAPRFGASFIKALFPRAYIDPNREAWELDPAMFAEPLPPFVNTRSPRVAAGLGTVARVVATGAEIYRDKLSFADVSHRVERCWRPYHAALDGLLADLRRRHGWCLLIDCHSMPSIGGPCDRDPGAARVDAVLGDGFGTSCATLVMRTAEQALTREGLTVARNDPYAGGFVTRHYGRPDTNVHALQIELNRALYMDEARIEPNQGFARLAASLERVIADLVALDLAPGAARARRRCGGGGQV
jgi:N-formylglutamate amidohydrolase